MLSDGVEDPVHLGGPSAVMRVVHLLHKVVQRLLWPQTKETDTIVLLLQCEQGFVVCVCVCVCVCVLVAGLSSLTRPVSGCLVWG